MYKTGISNLPLHGGKAPSWLTQRMTKLALEIINIMIDEYGVDKLVQRFSDPYWFQAFGCVLAYDWHSSGVTTVVTGILKRALSADEHGVALCGGKGKTSRKTPKDIATAAEKFGFSEKTIEDLTYASRIVAKVDNAAIQDGYQLYHHVFLVTRHGNWGVIQQGMNLEDRSARRYHWLGENTKSFVAEPNQAIACNTRCEVTLNMVAKESEGARKASVDLSKEPPTKLFNLIQSTARPSNQSSLHDWLPEIDNKWSQSQTVLNMPRHINWDTLCRLYEFQPRNYEELLSIQGVGPATVRGLALISELIYGEAPSWKDPVKYSFAYGGKDGVPYPVDRKSMDNSIELLRQTVAEARIGNKEKLRSLQRLKEFIPLEANS
jgi:hypothetical protein